MDRYQTKTHIYYTIIASRGAREIKREKERERESVREKEIDKRKRKIGDFGRYFPVFPNDQHITCPLISLVASQGI